MQMLLPLFTDSITVHFKIQNWVNYCSQIFTVYDVTCSTFWPLMMIVTWLWVFFLKSMITSLVWSGKSSHTIWEFINDWHVTAFRSWRSQSHPHILKSVCHTGSDTCWVYKIKSRGEITYSRGGTFKVP